MSQPANSLIPAWSHFLHDHLVPWGGHLLAALLILVIGLWIARIIGRIASRTFSRMHHDVILSRFLESIIKAILYVVVAIAALGQLGVQTTSLLAVLGAAGLAIGLALQKSLSDFAAGVLLLILRPFTVGDFVEVAGTTGTVERIHLFQCIFHSPDNRQLIVPNSKIFGNVITNYTSLGQRRIDLIVGISYDADIRKAKDIIKDLLHADSRILNDPAPSWGIMELADSSVNLYVRPWVKVKDFWATRCDLLEAIKLAFDRDGITIPFPQMEVHLNKS